MYMKKVENNDKYRSAHQFYWQYRSAEGKDYLFSQNQLDVAHRRAEKNPEDLQDISWIDSDAGTFTVAAVIGAGFGVMGTVCVNLLLGHFGG